MRVSSTTDEKFDRNLRGKAGAGSGRPCVLCSLTWSDCLCAENFGPLPVKLTNTLEREAADFCLDNPLELKRKDLDDLSLGMKRMRLTEMEVSRDIPDSLHLHINVSGSFMFKIACRIFCFGGDENPVFHWEKTASVKERIQQSEVGYARNLQTFISSLPSLNQMPGNFGRAFIDQKNRLAVLEPLPECTAKEVFTEILDVWERMCITHCKTSPTPSERLEYGQLSRKIQTLMKSLEWIKRWPNQFSRACHHNSFFLNDPEGTGSIGPHSTEPLEAGNHWIKMYDDRHTFKGDREAAIKGVFKLRRLKSSPKLQNFFPKLDKEIQKCSVCHNPGHNRRNASCPGPVLEEGDSEEEAFTNTVEVEESENEVQDLERDAFDREEDNVPPADSTSSFFFLYFVNETILDDD